MLPSVPPALPPGTSNIRAPPAILAVIRLRLAPQASIWRSVSRMPVSAYFMGDLRPVSMFKGSMTWTRAASFSTGSRRQMPMQEPRAYVTSIPSFCAIFISAIPTTSLSFIQHTQLL